MNAPSNPGGTLGVPPAADVNLGNIAIDDVVALETLRVGLRADTAVGP